MSEGERKRRIREKSFVCVEDATVEEEERDVGVEGYKVPDDSLSINWEEIVKVLDEVRADFPEIVEGEVTTWEEMSRKQDLKLVAINNWFKRWFGGAEK